MRPLNHCTGRLGSASMMLTASTLCAAIAAGAAHGQTVGTNEGTTEDAQHGLLGALSTQGTVDVRWNNKTIPITDGNYAYVGGERLTTHADAFGLLQLGDQDAVLICPDSIVDVTGEPSRFTVNKSRGSTDLSIGPQRHFAVNVADATLYPLSVGTNQDPRLVSEKRHVAQVTVDDEDAVLVCNFSGILWVDHGAVDQKFPELDERYVIHEAEVARITPAGEILRAPIPTAYQLGAGDVGTGTTGAAGFEYACQCGELAPYFFSIAPPPIEEEEPQEESPEAEPEVNPEAPVLPGSGGGGVGPPPPPEPFEEPPTASPS